MLSLTPTSDCAELTGAVCSDQSLKPLHKLYDLPGLVPPALPWWTMPLVLWRTCPRVTYHPPVRVVGIESIMMPAR